MGLQRLKPTYRTDFMSRLKLRPTKILGVRRRSIVAARYKESSILGADAPRVKSWLIALECARALPWLVAMLRFQLCKRETRGHGKEKFPVRIIDRADRRHCLADRQRRP